MSVVNPLISVVMSVRNGEKYLREAVDSILNQTLSEFEFLILNNGSKDNTLGILNEYGDSRMRIISQEDLGLAGSLNKGVKLSRGELIARQDADDISYPERLEKQAARFRSNSRLGLLGTAARIYEEDIRSERLLQHPGSDDSLVFDLLINNPFVHTSVMFRKSAFEAVGGYTQDPSRQPPEDFELWSRIVREFEVGNLAEELVAYREVPGSMSRNGVSPFLAKLRVITAENVAFFDGGSVQGVHRSFAEYVHRTPGEIQEFSRRERARMARMLRRVEAAVRQTGLGDKSESFLRVLSALERPVPPVLFSKVQRRIASMLR